MYTAFIYTHTSRHVVYFIARDALWLSRCYSIFQFANDHHFMLYRLIPLHVYAELLMHSCDSCSPNSSKLALSGASASLILLS